MQTELLGWRRTSDCRTQLANRVRMKVGVLFDGPRRQSTFGYKTAAD